MTDQQFCSVGTVSGGAM